MLVPIVAIICVVGLPIGFGMYLGLTAIRAEHKERMNLINQGIIAPEKIKRKATPNQFVSLRNGIVLVALGIGIILGFLCSEKMAIPQYNKFWIIAASIVFFLGLGYLSYFLITRKMPDAQQKEEVKQE